jgi:hypothetical protein
MKISVNFGKDTKRLHYITEFYKDAEKNDLGLFGGMNISELFFEGIP